MNIRNIFFFLPDSIYMPIKLRLKFWRFQGYWPHFKKWRTLNEYINHVILYDRNPMREVFCDRLAVREYVRTKTDLVSIIPTFWAGIDFTKEVWEKLPEKFVIKANHGSGMVAIIDKKKDNFNDVHMKVTPWLNYDFSKVAYEWFYKNLPKYLICEEFLSDSKNQALPDYKIFVINGKAEMVQINLDRFSDEHETAIYDRDFNKLPVALEFPNEPRLNLNTNIEKPIISDRIIQAAEEIADNFPFLRIDFYINGNEIYFGEITNSPGGGGGKFTPAAYDFELGEKISQFK